MIEVIYGACHLTLSENLPNVASAAVLYWAGTLDLHTVVKVILNETGTDYHLVQTVTATLKGCHV